MLVSTLTSWSIHAPMSARVDLRGENTCSALAIKMHSFNVATPSHTQKQNDMKTNWEIIYFKGKVSPRQTGKKIYSPAAPPTCAACITTLRGCRTWPGSGAGRATIFLALMALRDSVQGNEWKPTLVDAFLKCVAGRRTVSRSP